MSYMDDRSLISNSKKQKCKYFNFNINELDYEPFMR